MNPIANTILIRRHDKTTESGLIVPGDSKLKPSVGEVVSVPPDVQKSPVNIEPGDKVLYRPNTEKDVRHLSETEGLHAIKYQNVIAVL